MFFVFSCWGPVAICFILPGLYKYNVIDHKGKKKKGEKKERTRGVLFLFLYFLNTVIKL